jgi:hypothetical protein
VEVRGRADTIALANLYARGSSPYSFKTLDIAPTSHVFTISSAEREEEEEEDDEGMLAP